MSEFLPPDNPSGVGNHSSGQSSTTHSGDALEIHATASVAAIRSLTGVCIWTDKIPDPNALRSWNSLDLNLYHVWWLWFIFAASVAELYNCKLSCLPTAPGHDHNWLSGWLYPINPCIVRWSLLTWPAPRLWTLAGEFVVTREFPRFHSVCKRCNNTKQILS